MKIYPKVSRDPYCENMDEAIKKSEGIEIQFFDENGITSPFNFEESIIKMKTKYPNLKEIIIHPPLNDYNIELIFLKDENIFRNQLKSLANLSKELDINLDIIYHTLIPVRQYISTGLDIRIKDALKIIEGTNVTVLIENLFMMLEERVYECSAIEIGKHINHPNLRCCIDTTHIHCKANILKLNYIDMIKKEMNREDCERYVKQIHFASALNNDGYIEKKTHGRKHESIESLQEEYSWLCNLGLADKNYVTEVSEDDYYTRVDQLEEIKMLESIVGK